MSATVTIQVKQPGKTQLLLPQIAIPFPHDLPRAGGQKTVRDLLAFLVQQQVRDFNERQTAVTLFQVLSMEAINAGARRGKIDSGERAPQFASDEQAVDTALQAFVDGLFFLFVDGRQYENLDDAVYLLPDSDITLIRLVALAGG